MTATATCETWEEAISARLDGELGPADEARLDQHLESCVTCARFAEITAAQHRSVRVRPADDVPDLTHRILADAGDHHLPRHWILGGVAAAVALIAGVVGVVGLVGGDQPAPSFATIDGVATTARQGMNGAIYLQFVNDGGGDELTGATASAADRTELHVTENRDGLLVMLHEDTRPISAHGTTLFAPGGSHVMLNGLHEDLDPGDVVEITLEFERSGSRTIAVPVVGHADLPDAFIAGT